MSEKDPREMTRDELWEWAKQCAIEAVEKEIDYWRERFRDQIIFNDDLISPEDLENPGPAKHIKLSRLSEDSKLRMDLHDCVDDWREPQPTRRREIINELYPQEKEGGEE